MTHIEILVYLYMLTQEFYINFGMIIHNKIIFIFFFFFDFSII